MRKASHRQYSREFKVQVCAAIRAGAIGRREAERSHRLSGGLLHVWLGKFDRGELCATDDPERRVAEHYEARIAELERMVGRLTIENDRLCTAFKQATASNDNGLPETRVARST